MISNENFRLTADQLQKLSSWIDNHSTAWAKDDDQLSFELTVSFSFSVIGRRVIAKIGEGECLTIEESAL